MHEDAPLHEEGPAAVRASQALAACGEVSGFCGLKYLWAYAAAPPGASSPQPEWLGGGVPRSPLANLPANGRTPVHFLWLIVLRYTAYKLT
jgi:hypothetical protein